MIFKIMQRAFFDVRVFNPLAKSHPNQKLNAGFTTSENERNINIINVLSKLKMAHSLHWSLPPMEEVRGKQNVLSLN